MVAVGITVQVDIKEDIKRGYWDIFMSLPHAIMIGMGGNAEVLEGEADRL